MKIMQSPKEILRKLQQWYRVFMKTAWHGNTSCITCPLWGGSSSEFPSERAREVIFCLFFLVWISCWTDSQGADYLRRHDAHVMLLLWVTTVLIGLTTTLLNCFWERENIYFSIWPMILKLFHMKNALLVHCTRAILWQLMTCKPFY